MPNMYQSTSSGKGLLKDYYEDNSSSAGSKTYRSLKKKRKKLAKKWKVSDNPEY